MRIPNNQSKYVSDIFNTRNNDQYSTVNVKSTKRDINPIIPVAIPKTAIKDIKKKSKNNTFSTSESNILLGNSCLSKSKQASLCKINRMDPSIILNHIKETPIPIPQKRFPHSQNFDSNQMFYK